MGSDSEVADELHDVVETVVCCLVDHPDDVRVRVDSSSRRRLIVELETHASDVGQVVGASGRVIDSVRKILNTFGGKHRLDVHLDFLTDMDIRNARDGRDGRDDRDAR